MNTVVDFHVHPFLNVEQSLCIYENTVPTDALEMKKHLQSFGVERVCGSVLRMDRTFDLLDLNDAALRLRDVLGDFYLPGFHVHPALIDPSIREIERMHAAGVRLIGELVPYMHGWGNFADKPYVKELNEILSAADAYQMVCSFHTMWEWPIDEVIAAHPQLSFVAAHPGERESVEKHIQRMKRFKNVYLDLSGTGIFRFGCIRRLVDAVGADRILFGTDYPICNPEMYIHAVLGERLGADAEEAILFGNAKRLMRLG